MSRFGGDSGLFTMAEFKNRGVVKLAPDALVYISGNTGSRVVAPVTGKDQQMDFADGITSINIQNNVDPPGSSTASIEVTSPIYNEFSNYWIKFNDELNRTTRIPFFTPMMEVRIYLRGRFLVDEQPQYYPSFWGIITNVEENYSGGVHKINISCVDMLHWWEYSIVNVSPTPETNVAANYKQDLTAYSTIFKRANPFTIIYTLSRDMGMHQFVTPTWLGQKTPLRQIYPPNAFEQAANGIMAYWQQRFGEIGSLLKMYGMSGGRVNAVQDPRNGQVRILEPEEITNEDRSASSKASNATASRMKKGFNVDDTFLQDFSVFFEFDNMSDLDDAEYMTKLQIATEVKNRVEYEFFQDVNGNFIFKPPFYNLNVKNQQPYVVKPNDIINASFSIDSESIISVLEVNVPFHEQLRNAGYPKGIGFHMDMDLMNRYGNRFKRITLNYVQNASVANSLAVGHLSLINAKAFVGSVTLPGRPELRLGYPIFMEYRDSFHYVKSINHAFDYGGSFTTTLSLEAERKKVYELKSGKWDGPLKNRIYKFRHQVETSIDKGEADKTDVKKDDLLRSQRRIVAIDQGRYERVPQENASQSVVQAKSVPYTDESGYRVIGSFRYGRGVVLRKNSTMDSAEVTQAQSRFGEDLVQQQEVQSVTQMSLSQAESEAMKGYFSEDQEGIVPAYLTSYRIVSEQASQQNVAENLVGSTSEGSTREDTGRLVNDQQNPPPRGLTFTQAYNQAVGAGQSNFTWNGRLYQTELTTAG